MLISQKTIDEVYNLELLSVLQKFLPQLKKSGSGWKCNSPFTDEKTPSFNVSASKNIWKCFSTGKGGNSAISFVMEAYNMPYPDAIISICEKCNIVVDYEAKDAETAKKYAETKQQHERYYQLNADALAFFVSKYAKLPEKYHRTSPKMTDLFQIGVSDGDFQSLKTYLTNKGYSIQEMLEIDLITKSDKGTFDKFNSRLIFPILNHRGQIAGFTGRILETDKKQAKYINSASTPIYNKSEILYGFFQGKEAIRNIKQVFIVEGQTDVTSMFENNIENTAACGGTALTPQHINFLKKHVDTVFLMFDGDNPGLEAARKTINLILMEQGLYSYIIQLPKNEQGEPHDPDTILQSELFEQWKKDHPETPNQDFFIEKSKDGVEWLIEDLFTDAETTVQKSNAQKAAEEILSRIPDARLRNQYINNFKKLFGVTPSNIKKNVEQIQNERLKAKQEDDSSSKIKFPPGANEKDYHDYGFVQVHKPGSNRTGYYFAHSGQTTTFEQKSNFIVEPLFHITGKENNSRLIKIINKRKTAVVEIPSKGFVSVQQFQEEIIKEGNYFFHGTKLHFNLLMIKLLEHFNEAEPINTLGWQKEGFWAFADGIANPNFHKVSADGIVSLSTSDKLYFLPAFSDVYKNVTDGDDKYENDRNFIYRRSKISFKDWSKQLIKVYGNNGVIGHAFLIAAIFRDVVFKTHSRFPHLYMFGPSNYGKSFFAESLNSVFHGTEVGFNLNSGTNVGFFRRLARFRNALVWFEEFRDDIDPKRFQGIKQAYDGLGHEKGLMDKSNRTTSTKINSASIITSQYLSTADGNAVNNRTMVLYFDKDPKTFPEEIITQAKILKEWETDGLSSLIMDVIKYRDKVSAEYPNVSHDVLREMREVFKNENEVNRVVLNYSLVMSVAKILENSLPLPYTFEELKNIAIKQIRKQSEDINSSDPLAKFWEVMEYLFTEKVLEANKDFKIEQNQYKVSVKGSDGKTKKKDVDGVDIMYLRLNRVMPKYLMHLKAEGNLAQAIDKQTFINYLKQLEAYVGLSPSIYFQDMNTSAFAFEYKKLNIKLQLTKEQENASEPQSEDDLPF